MRITNILSLALTIALLPLNFAFGTDAPVYKDGLLTIPSVNTAEQVGQYQDVTFKLTEQGTWQLLNVKTIGPVAFGTPGVWLAWVDRVDAIKTNTFPVQVFLRVSGGFSPCNNATLGQINQRLENNRFDLAITYNFLVSNPPVICAQGMVNFIKTLPLPVYGLSASTYSYNVNGTTGTFELTADNKYPGDY